MLTMIHNNPARLDKGWLQVDRKFHVGMQNYIRSVRAPILSVHPELQNGQSVMDRVDVPCDELGYQVVTLAVDAHGQPTPEAAAQLRKIIGESRLVYGYGYHSSETARSLGVPYIMILEYDLGTQLTVRTTQVRNPIRKAVRSLLCTWKYARRDIPAMRHAHSLHCNGYPIYDETRHINPNRMLYLDSRMPTGLVITEDELEARLATQRDGTGRPLRLLFSGRYEPLKGALHAVQVAVECLLRGLNIEMHCYGQGSLARAMRQLATSAPERARRIHVHDAVPYPELARLAKGFDVFVCCHIQSDPSCTYLESFGAGLPIVGYANRMWRRLSEVSQAGFSSPMKKPSGVADHIARLIGEPALREQMSRRARQFALDHAYEHEFARRIDAVNAALESLACAAPSPYPDRPLCK